MTDTEYGLLNYMYSLNLLGFNSGMPRADQLMYETIAGSHGRGVASPTSDLDVIGIFVPDYETLYPYKVPGFGTRPANFKVIQKPSIDVTFEGLGNMTVDVQALNVVHFFNMLLKSSPNHVEYLYFNDDMKVMGAAGEYLMQHRRLFMTQALIRKFVAAGLAIAGSGKDSTNKELALATRFFIYAYQVYAHQELRPDAVRDTNMRVLHGDQLYVQSVVDMYKSFALEIERSTCTLPQTVNEEAANKLLLAVLKLHWAEQSVKEQHNG